MTGKLISMQTYPDGTPYRSARGHRAPRRDLEDLVGPTHAVVDLLLVDGGASASWVSVNLSAARTAFDKMCGASVTLGLVTPRRSRTLPVVPSKEEVLRLLEAAPSRRDKLLLGLMYATGMRVGEVVRLRRRDVDGDRAVIAIWQGKGRKDRQVMLPESLRSLLMAAGPDAAPDAYVFPSPNVGRHLSPRVAHRVMTAATRLATWKARPVVSPLDALAAPPLPTASPVGRMRLSLSRCPDGTTAATVTILGVELSGITLTEARPGWITMDLPPAEAWASAMSRLPLQVRARLQEPELYETLRDHLTRRFLLPFVREPVRHYSARPESGGNNAATSSRNAS